MSYEDYKWYLKAIEALWNIDVLTDHQHDNAVAKVEKMYNNTRKDLK